MNEKIQQYLQEIEREKNIKVLWACETGSRAWGFPSPDSDFDIRMIYVHKAEWYFSLTERKDSIERMLDNNDIDITGWELRKSLNLLRKSNAALLERIQSPIVYMGDEEFIADLRELSNSFYSRIATMHHYLSMSKKFVNDLDPKKGYKLKRFFYTLRSASVCKWIAEKTEVPPIEFEHIYRNLSLDQQMVDRIDELIALKGTKSESYMHKGDEELIAFIKTAIQDAEAIRKELPSSNGDLEALNHLFRKYIGKYDD